LKKKLVPRPEGVTQFLAHTIKPTRHKSTITHGLCIVMTRKSGLKKKTANALAKSRSDSGVEFERHVSCETKGLKMEKETVTFNEDGKALTIKYCGVEMPAELTFESVNDFVHRIETTYEDLESLCLGMANELEKKQKSLLEIQKMIVGKHPISCELTDIFNLAAEGMKDS